LPEYARPVFLRVRQDNDLTTTSNSGRSIWSGRLDPSRTSDPIFSAIRKEGVRAPDPALFATSMPDGSGYDGNHAGGRRGGRADGRDYLWRAAGGQMVHEDSAIDAEIAAHLRLCALPPTASLPGGNAGRRARAHDHYRPVPRNIFRGEAHL
jgi:hypothetical protein